jgi:uncharacterized protein (TIGR00251 family)
LIEAHPEGVILSIRAQASARVNAVRGEQGGALRVAVTQVAEKGKANKTIVELLAQTLGLRKSQLELMSGAASRQKRFLIRGITVAELQERLARVGH